MSTEKLEANFKEAGEALFRASTQKSRQSHHEQKYAQAYEALAKLGLRMRLKRKYRSNYVPGHDKG